MLARFTSELPGHVPEQARRRANDDGAERVRAVHEVEGAEHHRAGAAQLAQPATLVQRTTRHLAHDNQCSYNMRKAVGWRSRRGRPDRHRGSAAVRRGSAATVSTLFSK